MTAVSFTPAGPFSLAAAARFLEICTPAAYEHSPDGVLRLAFPGDDGESVIGCAVRQEETAGGPPATVHAEYTRYVDGRAVRPSSPGGTPADDAAGRATDDAIGEAADEAVRAQIARILSLDIDGTGFAALADADPVVAGLQAEFPGLRPVLFHSPYEAAAWTVIGNRLRMDQGARLKARIAEEYGQAVEVAGRTLHAFPTPSALRRVDRFTGLPGLKAERLRAIADAALDDRLNARQLRSQPVEFSLTDLKELPGVGPYSAELILIRGVGHPDVFPVHEPRTHQAMAAAYGLDAATAADAARLAAIAAAWRPYRSWVGLHLRSRAQERAAVCR
ncbi:DNA-3-methyladenine glycosylase 2 family protein [Streptomyces varsoviensis]|uniref:DNA-3-methyladenine glycosylase family protein n=1 Tax=Streptomyces varsoviensis TaxID=67373 RepID=UPI0033F60111